MTGIMIIIFWLLYPIAGTIAIIVLAILNGKHKRRINELLEQIRQQQRWEAQVQGDTWMAREEDGLEEISGGQGMETGMSREMMAGEPGSPELVQGEPGSSETVQGEPGNPKIAQENKEIPVSVPELIQTGKKSGVAPGIRQMPAMPSVAKREKIQVHPGLAALIIGVIFVVIAGLIFATTNWYVLPDMYKVVMVLGFSGLFFLTSRIAKKKMRIERTGRAFYILGSIFLFLAVLAVGYFRLLGPGFVLDGPGRWWVLWAGSVVTEFAFILGFRSYKEKVFTFVYLGGLSVSVAFLMAALRSYGAEFGGAMVCYAFALLVVGRLNETWTERSDCGFLPENAAAVWNTFSTFNFAVSACLMLPKVILGFFIVYRGSFLNIYQITPWNILCMGMIAAGTAILAVTKKEQPGYRILYRVILAVFLQYTAFGIPASAEYRHLIAAMLHGGWFTLGRRNKRWLRTEIGDVIMTGSAALNTGLLFINALSEIQGYTRLITASAGIVIMAGLVFQWSRQYPVLRRGMLYLLGLLTATGYGICVNAGLTEIKYHHILFAYLILVAVWDIVKKDCFWADILAVGLIPQILYLLIGIKTSPFFLFLSGYLFLKTRGRDGNRERMIVRWSCICSLIGAYLEFAWRLPNRVLAMFVLVALLLVEYVISAKWNEFWKRDWIWDAAGSGLAVMLMVEFYQSGGLGTGYLAACLGMFFLLYGKVYMGKHTFAHLPMVLVMLPLPWYIALAYDFTDNQILGATALMILASGILFRLHGPVHVSSGDGKHTLQVDWYHILIGPVLIILAGAGGRKWESVYTILIILYVLQHSRWQRRLQYGFGGDSRLSPCRILSGWR